jgi:DNA-directed RNA polymerase specialized sigma24 family protein
MLRHLIDQARARPAARFVALEKLEAFLQANSARVGFALTVDELLDQLAKHQPECCALSELKYFIGLSDEEASEVMGVKLRTRERMRCQPVAI